MRHSLTHPCRDAISEWHPKGPLNIPLHFGDESQRTRCEASKGNRGQVYNTSWNLPADDPVTEESAVVTYEKENLNWWGLGDTSDEARGCVSSLSPNQPSNLLSCHSIPHPCHGIYPFYVLGQNFEITQFFFKSFFSGALSTMTRVPSGES